MKKSGWEKTKKPKPGCVILWENQKGHEHLGFYFGKKSAISNDSKKKIISEHHWTYGADKNGKPKRKIIGLYWNKKLD
jgi:hypothetical protein